jgi:hypothetical protein
MQQLSVIIMSCSCQHVFGHPGLGGQSYVPDSLSLAWFQGTLVLRCHCAGDSWHNPSWLHHCLTPQTQPTQATSTPSPILTLVGCRSVSHRCSSGHSCSLSDSDCCQHVPVHPGSVGGHTCPPPNCGTVGVETGSGTSIATACRFAGLSWHHLS